MNNASCISSLQDYIRSPLNHTRLSTARMSASACMSFTTVKFGPGNKPTHTVSNAFATALISISFCKPKVTFSLSSFHRLHNHKYLSSSIKYQSNQSNSRTCVNSFLDGNSVCNCWWVGREDLQFGRCKK